MKNLLALLCVLAVIGTANAVYLTDNGDFEAVPGFPGDGWGVWAGGGLIAVEQTSGGNPGQFVSLNAFGSDGWAGWFNQDGVGGELDVLGIPAGETVTVACDIKSLGGSLTAAGLKVESWVGGVGGFTADYVQYSPPSGSGATVTGPLGPITTSWANYSLNYTLTSDATELIVNMMNLVSDTPDAFDVAHIGFDNITVTVPGKALRPVPAVGALLPDDATAVTWEKPAGTSTVAAYLYESDTELVNEPNLGQFSPGVFEPGTQTLVVDGSLESADVTGLLNADKYYYWNVHVNGTAGYTWNFQASGDSVPTVVAVDDQYLVTAGSPTVLNLAALVTDDGAPTTTWTDISNLGDRDPDTIVTIDTPSSVITTVTLTNAVSGVVNGWYQFEITVDDGFNPPVADQTTAGVYGTCAEAAAADPLDGWVSVGDLDGSCKTDLVDFALFAGSWLDCDALRVSCP